MQLLLQTLFYIMFLPALVGVILFQLRRERWGVVLIDMTTLLLTISQIILATLLLTLQPEFEIVHKSSAAWMNTWQRIGASWTDRWGSYHLWTWFTWMCLSAFHHRLKNGDRRFFNLLNWSSLLILFLLMGQRPYRAAETTGYMGLSPSLISVWNILHPPLAFAAYTGYFLSWAISSYIWVYRPQSDFSERLLAIDVPITRITWVLNSLMMSLGILWSHESNWGGYWLWDSVQVLGLVLWLISSLKLHLHARKSTSEFYNLINLTGFSTVFFAAWIITSGILSGLHNYAPSPVAWLFVVLTFITLIPMGVGFVRHRWRISSPVQVDRSVDQARFSGLNLGILSFVLLISGNLLTILLQVLMAVTGVDVDYSLLFPYINYLGVAMMMAGMAFDQLVEERGTWRYIPPAISALAIAAFLLMDYRFAEGWDRYAQLLTLFLVVTTIVAIVQSLPRDRQRLRIRVSHMAFALVLLTVVANGAGPAVHTRTVFPLDIGEERDLGAYTIRLTGVTDDSGPRGTVLSANVYLTSGSMSWEVSTTFISQEFYGGFIRPVSVLLPNGKEVFITLSNDPFRTELGRISGANMIVEEYILPQGLYLGIVLFIAVLAIPRREIRTDQ